MLFLELALRAAGVLKSLKYKMGELAGSGPAAPRKELENLKPLPLYNNKSSQTRSDTAGPQKPETLVEIQKIAIDNSIILLTREVYQMLATILGSKQAGRVWYNTGLQAMTEAGLIENIKR